jgi:hypothetical protein
MKKTLFMETTGIAPNKSVAEIQELLAEYGASAVLIEYENNDVKAVSFKHKSDGEEIPYRLPSEWRGIRDLLSQKHKRKPYKKDLDTEAKRIAWRQSRRWVEAQLAYLESRQVKFEQLFLPYRLINATETLYERLEAMKFKLLPFKEKE